MSEYAAQYLREDVNLNPVLSKAWNNQAWETKLYLITFVYTFQMYMYICHLSNNSTVTYSWTLLDSCPIAYHALFLLGEKIIMQFSRLYTSKGHILLKICCQHWFQNLSGDNCWYNPLDNFIIPVYVMLWTFMPEC